MNMWDELLGNQLLVSAVLGWVVAQGLKTLIDFALNKSFNKERLVGSGGMPSSHSATVCGLTTAAVIKYGVGSFEFAISFVLSMIVWIDCSQSCVLTSCTKRTVRKLSAAPMQTTARIIFVFICTPSWSVMVFLLL